MCQGKSLGELRNEAVRFREALESIPPAKRPIALTEFPGGACGDATLLLGTYFIEIGEVPFDYMLGDTTEDHLDPSWSSHAWMQRGNLVIDISADQFPHIDEKVIVTLDSVWHRSLNGEVQHIADFNVYEQNTASPLGPIYRAIRDKMNDT